MSRGDGKDEIPQRPASGRSEAPRTALRTREVLQLVLDSIPVRVFWKDLESVYLGCNLLFAADAGLDSPAEIVGRNDFELSWRKQAELYRGDDRQVMQTGEPKITLNFRLRFFGRTLSGDAVETAPALFTIEFTP